MRRNSGLIGSKSLVTTTGARGIFDTFDVYNYRKTDIWPKIITEFYTLNIIPVLGTNSSTSPGICNIYFRRSIFSFVYTSAELTAQMGTGTKSILKLRFFVTEQPANQPLPDYAVGMKTGIFSGNPGFYDYTIVSPPKATSFTTNAYTEIVFEQPFVWTSGSDIAFVFAWGQCPVNYSASGTTQTGAGQAYYETQDGSGAYTINTSTTNNQSSDRPVLQLFYS